MWLKIVLEQTESKSYKEHFHRSIDAADRDTLNSLISPPRGKPLNDVQSWPWVNKNINVNPMLKKMCPHDNSKSVGHVRALKQIKDSCRRDTSRAFNHD